MILTKKFNAREKFLLVVLALLLVTCFYYFFVHRPVNEQLTTLAAEKAEIESDIMVFQTQYKIMENMSNEIKANEENGMKAAEIPVYDNLQNVMNMLNLTLSSTEDYNLSFNTTKPAEGDNIVRRVVMMNYTTQTYHQSREVIDSLQDSPYRCLIGDFSIKSKESQNLQSSQVTTNLTLTFFERLN